MALGLLLVSSVAAAHCGGKRTTGGMVAEATGQVRGRVFDEYGGSIPDAAFLFQPADSRSGLPEFGGVADGRGRFDFEGVRPGMYRVTGRALGYATTVEVHEVRPGVQTEVTIVLRPMRLPSSSTTSST